MASPRLFLHIHDPCLAADLVCLAGIRQYELNISHKNQDWLEQLSQCDLAIIEVDSQHDKTLQKLAHHPLLSKIEFLFLSQGKPDPIIDTLMNQGAGFHYRAPFNFPLIETSLNEAFYELTPQYESNAAVQASYLDQFGLLVGSSAAMHHLYRTIKKVAVTKANTFIIGESGTGKELIANTLHIFSPRTNSPFIAINCGALSPELIDSELFGHVKGSFTGAHKDHQGVFEQAQGGTLFLDEITEMPYEHQVKLLRVLESREYKPVGGQAIKIADVRIIAATNRAPKEAIDQEIFREDLYFRLAQFPIMVPALRERGEDACGLAQHFLTYLNNQEGQHKHFSSESLAKIRQYDWPGNVRELKHAVERAHILADDLIEPHHLMTSELNAGIIHNKHHSLPTGMRLEDMEKMAITNTLEENDGNKTDTAQQLGISVKTLYNKLDKYQSQRL